MEGDMGDLEQLLGSMFDALANKDAAAVNATMASDVRAVDEISRKWLRGKDEVGAYIDQLVTMVDEVKTEWNSVDEQIWGDVGLLTCWMEQDYVLEGTKQHVSAPTSMVFRKEGGGWKVAHFHSIPLPEEG
jgi:uncharacterized protein (TIGR02246 family)